MRTINAWTQGGIKSSQWSFRPQHFPSSLESWDALACNAKESIGKKVRKHEKLKIKDISMHFNGEPLTFGIFCFFLDQTDDHDPVTQCNQTPPFSDYVRELFWERYVVNPANNETVELWMWTISQDECEVCVQCTYMNGRVRYSIPFPAMFNNKYTAELVSKKTT